MGVAERRAREKETLRQNILVAAAQIVAEEGYQQLSIRKLAERIEYAPATIYLYFKDRAELLDHICSSEFSELATQLNQIREADPSDPLRALRNGLRFYITWGVSHPGYYVTMFSGSWREATAPTPLPPCTDDIQCAGAQCFQCLTAMIEACIESQTLHRGEAGVMAHVAWASVHGLTLSLIQMRDGPLLPPLPPEDLIAAFVNHVLAGLAASPSAA